MGMGGKINVLAEVTVVLLYHCKVLVVEVTAQL